MNKKLIHIPARVKDNRVIAQVKNPKKSYKTYLAKNIFQK
jgi:hypothetical protein